MARMASLSSTYVALQLRPTELLRAPRLIPPAWSSALDAVKPYRSVECHQALEKLAGVASRCGLDMLEFLMSPAYRVAAPVRLGMLSFAELLMIYDHFQRKILISSAELPTSH